MKRLFLLTCMAIMTATLSAQSPTEFTIVQDSVSATLLSNTKKLKFDLNRSSYGRNLVHYSDGLCAVINSDRQWGFVDTSGKLVIGFTIEDDGGPYYFSDGWCAVPNPDKRESMFYYIDHNGKVMPKVYNQSADYSFSEGVLLVMTQTATDQKRSLYDTKGKLVPNSTATVAVKSGWGNESFIWYGFSEGLAPIWGTRETKYGYIDKTGKMVIAAAYNQARPFSEGLAAVMISPETGYGNKWGFIDKTGKVVIPIKLESQPGAFHDGLAGINPTYTGDSYNDGYIDRTGKVVIAPSDALKNFSDFSGGYAMAGYYGSMNCIIDKTGNIIANLSEYNLKYKAGDPSGRPWFLVEGVWETKRIAKIDLKNRTISLSPEGMDFITGFYDGRAAVRYTKDGVTYRGFVNEQYEFILIEE